MTERAMSHRLGWQDDHMAELETCGTTTVESGHILNIDGDLGTLGYAGQVCPVCGKQLRLIWDVRAEVRDVGDDSVTP